MSEPVGSGAAPVNTKLPEINGSAIAETTVYAEYGAWSGLHPITYRLQWERCNMLGETCEPIVGATEDGYRITNEEIGSTLHLRVTALNSDGEAKVYAHTSSVIVGRPPSGEASVRGETYVGETLTGAVGGLQGAKPIDVSYQWQRCEAKSESCADIGGATSASYTLTTDDAGARIRMLATFTNAYGEYQSPSSTTAVIANVAPSYISGLRIGPRQIGQGPGSILTAAPGTWSGSVPMTYAYQWEECDSQSGECTPLTGATSQSYTSTEGEVGHYLRATVTASNAVGAGASQTSGTIPIDELEAPRSVLSPTIEGEAKEDATLTINRGEWLWAPTRYTYQWELCTEGGGDCSSIEGATGESYETGKTDIGHRLEVRVTAFNRVGSSIAISQPSEVVKGAPPVNVTAPEVIGQAVVGNVFEVSPGTWLGLGIYPNYKYQWQVCNVSGEGCSDLEETGPRGESLGLLSTFTAPANDVGKTVRIKVTAPNATDTASTTATSNATAALATSTAPTDTTAPSIAGTPRDGETLRIDVGAWSGSPVLHFVTQWELCSATGEECQPIEDARAPEYELQRNEIGRTIRATVAASNDGGEAMAHTVVTAAVEVPEAPRNLEPPVVVQISDFLGAGSEFRLGETLYVQHGKWTGDATIVDQWERCDPMHIDPETGKATCTEVPGAAGALYKLKAADVGYELSLKETATNQTGSASVQTAISPQIVPPLVIGTEGAGYKGAAVVGQTIEAQSGIYSTPILPITTTYEFLRINPEAAPTVLQNGESNRYTLIGEDEGHQIEIKMVGKVWREDRAEEVGSETVNVQTHTIEGGVVNTLAPSVTGEALAGKPLHVSDGEWDGGGGSLTYAYQWELCDGEGGECASIAGATGPTYTPDQAQAGHELRVVVAAEDQGVSGSATSTASEEVKAASAMVNLALPSISGEPVDLGTLQASEGEWSGSEPVSYGYQWSSCSAAGTECSEVPGATGETYQPGDGESGSTFKVQVTATNAAGATSATSAASGPAGSVPPPVNEVAPRVTVLGPLAPDATLMAYGGSWENIDEATGVGQLMYDWQRCNTSGGECEDIARGGEKTYRLTSADVGHRLRVVVIAENNGGRASSTSQLTGTVEGALPEGSDRFVYASGGSLYQVGTEGREPATISTCGQADAAFAERGCVFRHPSISPTGEMIATEVDAENDEYGCGEEDLCANKDATPNGAIALVNYDGSDSRVLVEDASQPTWSPSGTSLLFTRAVKESEGDYSPSLYSVEADATGTPTPLEPGIAMTESAAYSPDGSQLTFVGRSSSSQAWSLYVANSDGSEPTRIALGDVGQSIEDPQFTTDGEHIVFLASNAPAALHAWSEGGSPGLNLYEVNVNGTELRRVTEDRLHDDDSIVVLGNHDLMLAKGEVVELTDGYGVSWQQRRAVGEKIGEGTEEDQVLPDVGDATGDLTAGILGPRAKMALWQACSKKQGVCGAWGPQNTERAYEYAKKYALKPNSKWNYYEDDCTDYVSQLLLYGGMKTLLFGESSSSGTVDENPRAWWSEQINLKNVLFVPAPFAPPHTVSWVNAEGLYNELLDNHIAVPVKSDEEMKAGDLVFYHWYWERRPINHVGMILSGNGHDLATEMYTQHTVDHLWSMAEELKAIGREVHEMIPRISVKEGESDYHGWQWHVLRLVHTGAYVPE